MTHDEHVLDEEPVSEEFKKFYLNYALACFQAKGEGLNVKVVGGDDE